MKNLIILMKSFFINIRIFNFTTALQFPILYAPNMKIKGIYRGCIILNTKVITKGMIKLGVDKEESNLKNHKNYLYFKKQGKMIFKGNVEIKSGMSILIDNKALLIFGNNLKVGSNLYIYCSSRIDIHDNVRLEFNVKLKNDNKFIVYEEEQLAKVKQIEIEDNVLIKANTIILGSTYIAKNSIISEGSLINKKLEKINSLYGGNPVRLIKKQIIWREK